MASFLSSALSSLAVYNNDDLREPELHIIGEIVGASSLDPNGDAAGNAFCAWELKTGRYWNCVGGHESGQTQVDYPDSLDESDAGSGMAVWNHPMDVHYFTKTVEGWPRLSLEVWQLDTFGGKQVLGYGFANVPSAPGSHELAVHLWRPCGTHREEMAEWFLGQAPQLVDRAVVHSSAKAKEDRHRLTTKAAGTVHVRVEVIARNFARHGVQS
jgi:B9 domain-containing protein 2